MNEIKLYDKVKIKKTGEIAVVVWIDENPNHNSYILEKVGKEEAPVFYRREDFEIYVEKPSKKLTKALKEADKMEKHPDKYKSYNNMEELIDDLDK